MKRFLSIILAIATVLNVPITTQAASAVVDENSGGSAQTLVNLQTPEEWQVKVPILSTLEIPNSSRFTGIRSLYVNYQGLANLTSGRYLHIKPNLDVELTRVGDDKRADAGLSGLDNDYLIEKPDVFRNGTINNSRYICLPNLDAGKWTGHITYDISILDDYNIEQSSFYKYYGTDPCPIDVLEGTYDDYYNTIPYYNATKIVLHDGYTDAEGVYHKVSKFDLSSWSNVTEITTDRTEPFQLYSLPSKVEKIDCNGLDVEFKSFSIYPNRSIKVENVGNVSTVYAYAYGYADGYYGWDLDPGEYDIKNVISYNGYSTRAEEIEIPEDIHSDYDYIELDGSRLPNLKKLTVPDAKYIKYVKQGSNKLQNLEELYYNEAIVASNAFMTCPNLKKVVLGPNCSYIEENAFAGCTSLEDVTMENKNVKLFASSFAGAPWYTNVLNEADHGVLKIGGSNLTFIVKDEVDEEMVYDYEDWDRYTNNIINLALVPHGTKTLKFSDRLKYRKDSTYDSVGQYNMYYYEVHNTAADIDLVDLSGMQMGQFVDKFPNAKKIIAPLAIYTNAYSGYDGKTNYTRNDPEYPELDISQSLYLVDMKDYKTFDTSYFTIPKDVKPYYSEYSYTYGDTYFKKNPFMNFGKDDQFNEFRVEAGNTSFKAVDGILYSYDGKQLISIPHAKQFENNSFVIPEGVEFGTNFAIDETKIDELTIPDSWDVDKSTPTVMSVFSSENQIKKYHVHDTNPNLYEVDGVLYRKDDNSVFAVPYGYEGELKFTDGCTGFNFEKINSDSYYYNPMMLYGNTTTYQNVDYSSAYPHIPYEDVTKIVLNKDFDFLHSSSSSSNNTRIYSRYFTDHASIIDIEPGSTHFYKSSNDTIRGIQSIENGTLSKSSKDNLGYYAMNGITKSASISMNAQKTIEYKCNLFTKDASYGQHAYNQDGVYKRYTDTSNTAKLCFTPIYLSGGTYVFADNFGKTDTLHLKLTFIDTETNMIYEGTTLNQEYELGSEIHIPDNVITLIDIQVDSGSTGSYSSYDNTSLDVPPLSLKFKIVD